MASQTTPVGNSANPFLFEFEERGSSPSCLRSKREAPLLLLGVGGFDSLSRPLPPLIIKHDLPTHTVINIIISHTSIRRRALS